MLLRDYNFTSVACQKLSYVQYIRLLSDGEVGQAGVRSDDVKLSVVGWCKAVSDGSTRRVLSDGKDGVRLSSSVRWCQMFYRRVLLDGKDGAKWCQMVLHGGSCQMVRMVSGRRVV